MIEQLIASYRSGDGSVHGLGQCAHCGARIRYHIVFEHIPTGAVIAVGKDCADGRFTWSDFEFKSWKKDLDARRKKAAELGKFQVWKECCEIVQREGMFQLDDKGNTREHPAMLTMEKAEKIFLSFAREFGCTPSARNNLKAPQIEQKAESLDDFKI